MLDKYVVKFMNFYIKNSCLKMFARSRSEAVM